MLNERNVLIAGCRNQLYIINSGCNCCKLQLSITTENLDPRVITHAGLLGSGTGSNQMVFHNFYIVDLS